MRLRGPCKPVVEWGSTELKFLHPNMHHLMILVEAQPTIRLIPIPQTKHLPNTVLIAPLLSGHQFTPHPGKLSRQMKTDARVNAGYEKLIRSNPRHKCSSMRILRARSSAPIGLREAKSNRRLPVAEVNLL